MAHVRQPAVAGSFYPRDTSELAADVRFFARLAEGVGDKGIKLTG